MPEEEDEPIGELREIKKEEEEDNEEDENLPKGPNKLLIGLLSLVVFFALFIFFKGEEEQQTEGEGVTIQTPSADSSTLPSNDTQTGLSRGNPESEPSPGEIRVGEDETSETANGESENTIVPIPKEELTFFDPLGAQQEEPVPAESEGLALIEAERTRVEFPENKTPAVVPPATKQPLRVGLFAIQVGAFQDKKSAEVLAGRLDKNGYDAYVVSMNDHLFRVRVGKFKTRKTAEKIVAQIKKIDRLDSFIIKN